MNIHVRRARPDESERLTVLAMKAKASWGYDDAFMEMCRAELALTPEKLRAWTVWVAECAGELAGMIALAGDAPDAELEDFMVEPNFQRQGVGAALMEVFMDECRLRGFKRVCLDADPNAESIYQKLGFTTISLSPSRSIPGRSLPRMAKAL
ncbi:GNAT family N-acetyltransferase [Brevundimonas sp.]|uniref:GNAT family N-acetyltransferase n=1 Tax=Brevundimonas sp. TaxID=1871086 RepID=UPI002ED84164